MIDRTHPWMVGSLASAMVQSSTTVVTEKMLAARATRRLRLDRW